MPTGDMKLLSLFELSNDTCRWPVDVDVDGITKFCGRGGADLRAGRPYCAQCAKVPSMSKEPSCIYSVTAQASLRSRDITFRFDEASEARLARSGRPDEIGKVFAGFQKFLYQEAA
jgi:hypothetical protein